VAPGIIIDPLTAQDRAAVAFTFRRLGKVSRYQRFQGIKTELAPRELEYLTVVDHWHHEALIARSTLPRSPVGIGRYVRGEEFDVAEVAIEVVDSRQRQGVGRALMRALRERALASGIAFFTAAMLAENRGAVALVRGHGPARMVSASGGVKQFEIDLRPEPYRRFAPAHLALAA
jgi:GNAT superfamily N-acetyltransferase